MKKARHTTAYTSRQRDPILTSLFKATGLSYDQGVVDLAALLMHSLQQVRDERAHRPIRPALNTAG